MFTPLTNIAVVSLGYKSLQNDFYYLNAATIEQFSIEGRFLKPVFMLADLNGLAFMQDAKPSQWLFYCKDKDVDIRGTGAIRYIEAMGDRAAKVTKQASKRQTIRQALAAQAGGLWYAPKAQPHEHHVWLRKSVDGTFAPLLFDGPVLVDQRCNSISPRDGLSWKEIAAVLTTSLFAYSLEINGSTSMGAGALEAPTTKLRDYPVFDVRKLSPDDRKELVKLAGKVWADTRPVDWTKAPPPTGGPLSSLDDWLLGRAGNPVATKTLYSDMRDACLTRIRLATDKVTKSKAKKASNIGGVAMAIAEKLRPRMQTKNFPEDFIDKSLLDLSFNVTPELVGRITIRPFLGQSDLSVEAKDGSTLISGHYDSTLAESIVRAILWGRSSFSLSSNKANMDAAINAFLEWIDVFRSEMDHGIADSALGTGYEDKLRVAVFGALGFHPLSLVKALPTEIVMPQ